MKLFDPTTMVDMKEEEQFDIDADLFPELDFDEDLFDVIVLTSGVEEGDDDKEAAQEFAQRPPTMEEIAKEELHDATIHLMDQGAVAAACHVAANVPLHVAADPPSLASFNPQTHVDVDPPSREPAMEAPNFSLHLGLSQLPFN